MAETQSAPSLRELSEAATQGKWRHYDEVFRKQFGNGRVTEIQTATGKAIVAWSGFDGLPKVTERKKNANARFIVALVNAFRAGRLIDPTTLTEAVAAARAEGRAAGIKEAVSALLDRRTENLAKFGTQSTRANECLCASEAVYDLIIAPAPPTTPGGRTDG